MKDSRFAELLEQEQYDELENYWLECLESGVSSVDDFLAVARSLGRHRMKDRAGVLMGLLDEHLREQQLWGLRLQVLQEIAAHLPTLKRVDDLREQIREAILQEYAGRPSTSAIFRHYGFEDLESPDQMGKAAREIALWLSHDIGEVFYREGYGTGVVTEINLNLHVLRVNFDGREATFEVGDQDLVPLPPGHILREKQQSPEQFQRRALEQPGEVLGQLLRTFGKPMTVGEIKTCLAAGIPAEHWSRWWTAARKNPQVLASGKGARAVYNWSDSAAAAEQALRDEFTVADVRKRTSMARSNLRRSPELEQYFLSLLAADARQAFEAGKWGVALELFELLSRRPGAAEALSYGLADVVGRADSAELLASVDNAQLKGKILNEIRILRPETWTAEFSSLLLKEEHPKILTLLLDSLTQTDEESARSLLDRVAANPAAHPAAFTWLTEMASLADNSTTLPALDQRFFHLLLKALDYPELAHFRTRLKKAIEGGLLVRIFSSDVEPEGAQKSLDLIERSDNIEEYRKERWRNSIRARVPQTREKEEWIFSTKEAYDRKLAELDTLIRVELPRNRKAVGEAAALGDLSENHEYKAARERQDYLINRVAQLQDDLKRVRVLDPGQIDCTQVRPGTRVSLVQPPEKKLSMTILGPWDSNPEEGVYSYQAPVGITLLGKLPGEKVEWNQEEWTVEKIEPWTKGE